MIITKITASDDGGSRFEDIEIEMNTAFVAEGLPPLRVSAPVPATSAVFLEQPAGAPDWAAHVAPRRQFVVLLSGRLAVETTDGERREFSPGALVLAEDTTGKGHVTKLLTDDVRIMTIPLAEGAPSSAK